MQLNRELFYIHDIHYTLRGCRYSRTKNRAKFHYIEMYAILVLKVSAFKVVNVQESCVKTAIKSTASCCSLDTNSAFVSELKQRNVYMNPLLSQSGESGLVLLLAPEKLDSRRIR